MAVKKMAAKSITINGVRYKAVVKKTVKVLPGGKYAVCSGDEIGEPKNEFYIVTHPAGDYVDGSYSSMNDAEVDFASAVRTGRIKKTLEDDLQPDDMQTKVEGEPIDKEETNTPGMAIDKDETPDAPHSAHVLANLVQHKQAEDAYLESVRPTLEHSAINKFLDKYKDERGRHEETMKGLFEEHHPTFKMCDLAEGVQEEKDEEDNVEKSDDAGDDLEKDLPLEDEEEKGGMAPEDEEIVERYDDDAVPKGRKSVRKANIQTANEPGRCPVCGKRYRAGEKVALFDPEDIDAWAHVACAASRGIKSLRRKSDGYAPADEITLNGKRYKAVEGDGTEQLETDQLKDMLPEDMEAMEMAVASDPPEEGEDVGLEGEAGLTLGNEEVEAPEKDEGFDGTETTQEMLAHYKGRKRSKFITINGVRYKAMVEGEGYEQLDEDESRNNATLVTETIPPSAFGPDLIKDEDEDAEITKDDVVRPAENEENEVIVEDELTKEGEGYEQLDEDETKACMKDDEEETEKALEGEGMEQLDEDQAKDDDEDVVTEKSVSSNESQTTPFGLEWKVRGGGNGRKWFSSEKERESFVDRLAEKFGGYEVLDLKFSKSVKRKSPVDATFMSRFDRFERRLNQIAGLN